MTTAAWAIALGLAALGWLDVLVAVLRFRRRRTLAEVEVVLPAGVETWPRVSVVVPSRDEEAEVERATRSLLEQDYPALEVVAIDDRSTDRTGAILDGLAAADARLQVEHVTDLPPGWLGKNNALRRGAARARGEWLLFTDGDIVFGRDAVRRAIAFALAHRLGHVVAIPRFVAPGFLERAFVSCFSALLLTRLRVWTLDRPGTVAYVGAGAFNLVRRDEYERVGGHEKLRMEVVDDVKLGLILRRSGVRQGAVDSGGLVSVRWQDGFLGSLRGLVKNAFAGMDWRWFWAVVVSLIFLDVGLAAPLAVGLAPGVALPLAGGAVVLVAVAAVGAAARAWCGGLGHEGLAFPVALLGMVGVTLWSALRTTLDGGISWRGTRYPLAELRRGNVRELDWPASGAVGWD